MMSAASTMHRRASEMASDPKPETPRTDPVIAVYLADVDRTLIRKNLRLTVEERFLQLMELQRFADELQRSTRGTKRK